MRKLSILFSFFLLSMAAVFAQTPLPCADITVISLEVVENPPGVYEVEMVLNNTSTTTYSSVSIDPTFLDAPTGSGNIIDVNAITSDILQGINTLNFTINNPNLLLDILDDTQGAFNLAALVDFFGVGIDCQEQAFTLTQINTWGCTDSTAFNYTSTATLDLGNCITTLCPYLDFFSFEITDGGNGDSIFQVIMLDSLEGFNLVNGSMTFTVTNTNGQNFGVDPSPKTFTMLAAANGQPSFAIIDFPMSTGLSDLAGDSLYLEGCFDYTVLVNGQIANCVLCINETIDISKIGCTDANAFNYDPYNIIDDGDCIYPIVVSPEVENPPCNSIPGSINIEDYTSGGTPPYSFNYYTVDPNTVVEGSYTFTVTDNTPTYENGPIVKHVTIVIPPAPLFYVNINLFYPQIVATVNAAVTKYYWLLDGVLIDSTYAPQYAYDEPGIYSCYVEGMNENGCYDYSNELVTLLFGIEEEFGQANIFVYPNPTSSELNVQGVPAGIEKLEYQIVNTVGARVQNGWLFEDRRIETDNLANGMYYLQLVTTDQMKMISFTVQQ